MMNTPICDFVSNYANDEQIRLHMPGHKGKSLLGFEKFDITEFDGADCLYHADGIIKESESNLTALYGTGASFYSCEGSSLSIRAMLYLAKVYTNGSYIMAGRNAHSTLISASALIGFDIEWLYPADASSYLSCVITPSELEKRLGSVDNLPFCVYITSPDYLGNISDIEGLSQVCEKFGVMLLVDNAHGAYLRFLENDIHPISLGATMCTDSAHKTLPALTGGAYLHISKNAPEFFCENAKSALGLFGSTSPSYLILSSLDRVNKYLYDGYKEKLSAFIKKVDSLKDILVKNGYTFSGNEPIKLTFESKKYGYRGVDFAKILKSMGIVCEFCDDDFCVLMLTPEITDSELDYIKNTLLAVEKKEKISTEVQKAVKPEKAMSIQDAIMSPREKISIENAPGRILAGLSVSCPPAVSLIVAGEKFTNEEMRICKSLDISSVYVVK